MNYLLPLLFLSSQVCSQNIETNTPSSCVCVQPHECSESGTVITDGHNIVDFRSSTQSICSEDLICCILNDTSVENVEDNTVANPEGDFENSSNDEFESNDFSTAVTQPEPQENHQEFTCGEAAYQDDLIVYKISGGLDESATELGDFPWMLLMMYEKNGMALALGGASLIHPQVALTAAHNIEGKELDRIVIRAAEFNLDSEVESDTQNARVKKIIYHPDYKKMPPKYDVAIIILEQPFTLSMTVRTICLPPKDSKPSWHSCLATGWGTRGNDAVGPHILRKVEMSLVPKDECNALLRKSGFKSHYKMHESFICAGSNTTADTCQGDGGGPLLCQPPDSKFYHLVGITSWGLDCKRKGLVPGAYTDVSLVLDFIESSLNSENINLNK